MQHQKIYIFLNKKLLTGHDVLHGLIGFISRIREGPIALTVEIESIFLPPQFPEQVRSCLRFLWPPRTNKPIQKQDNKRQVFEAKRFPIFANYALRRLGIDNDGVRPIIAKAMQKKYM